jgi:hypothetical protein
MTLYGLLLQRCGLSHREAAALHGVRLDTVASWSAGRRGAPAGAIAELRALYRQVEAAAARVLAAIDAVEGDAPDMIELGLSADDHEAQALGWPCVGAHAAVLGIVAARTDRQVRIVPRGTTLATAAAADAHRR